ncbi:peptidase [Arthrobacter sp. 2RAF22]|uniref:peptidase n=1 Tax=Arthrobacter sp. 2RAF22 TaxID=3232996 RepID=UPI003F8E8F38
MEKERYPTAVVDGFTLGMFVSYGDAGDAWVEAPGGGIATLIWETGSPAMFGEATAPDPAGQWGTYRVRMDLPLTTDAEAETYLRGLLPEIFPRWHAWAVTRSTRNQYQGSPREDGAPAPADAADGQARQTAGNNLRIGFVIVVVIAALTAAVFGIQAGVCPPKAAAAISAPAPTAVPTAASPKASPYFPTPGHEAHLRPLGFPAPLPGKSDSYAFLPGGAAGQKFVAYDPCRPVHYVVREANAPAGGSELIQTGFAELSRVTGLKFINDGTTQEAPSDARKPFQPGVYGDRWAPVLVAWTSETEYPTLASKETTEGTMLRLGVAGSGTAGIRDGRRVYVTGQVALNAPALAETAAYEGQPTVYGSVIAHELAHLVGEDHVQDHEQLMYPTRNGHLSGYAAGDLTGLAQLGQGPCAPEL